MRDNANTAAPPAKAADFCFRVDGGLYSAEAVQRVCYSLLDTATAWLERADDDILVYVALHRPLDQASVERRFRALLTDQQLRHSIEAQTRAIRDVLVTAALTEALPRLRPEGESG